MKVIRLFYIFCWNLVLACFTVLAVAFAGFAVAFAMKKSTIIS